MDTNKKEALRRALSGRAPAQVVGVLRPSAVAVLLLEAEVGLCVLLTKRAAHLRSYPGNYTLPGGRVEASDDSLESAALRETWEEIGVEPGVIEVLGRLDEQHTMSGYRLTPIVGWLRERPTYRINPDEVESVLELPVAEIETHSAVTLIPFKTYKVLWQLAGLLGVVPPPSRG